MSLVATVALAASSMTLPQCSWDRPGVNPFMGDLVAAVDRYKDIPAATRAKIKARMQERKYDEIVDIRRDSIVGSRYDYGAEIRDMHFGAGSVCHTVTRGKWKESTLERGLVYCEDGQCLLVPTVCRNVSRITRTGIKPAGAPVASKEEDATPLMFDPPGAGAPNVEGGGAGNGDAGSFARATALSNPVDSTPTNGGYTSTPTATPSLVVLPPGTSTGGGTDPNTPVPTVPEPGTWLLFALGLGALVAQRYVATRR